MKKNDFNKICFFLTTITIMGCATTGGGQDIVGSVDSGLATVEQAAQSGRQAISTGATTAGSIDTTQSGLVNMLVNQLGVSQQQALGGAGAIFQAAQANMEPQAFSSLSQSVPGINEMINAAPTVSDSTSGLMGGISSMMGGTDSTIGSMATLATSFQQLNLSPDMVGQFIPIVTEYVRNTSGQLTADLLQSALSVP